jgi:hypothetical protein
MTRPAAPAQATAAAPGRAGQWIHRTATITVAGLAGIAGALSYSHMRHLAEAPGQSGWHAHAFPLSVNGVEIVASLVLLASRRTGRKYGQCCGLIPARRGGAACCRALCGTAAAGTR